MKTNELPKYDQTDNPTGCCPRFKPEGWDRQDLHFEDKLFAKAMTRNLIYVPINMNKVFQQTFEVLQKADACDPEQFVVLTNDISPWKSEHYFAVTMEVPGMKHLRLNGDFTTRVFEGPYKNVPDWYHQIQEELSEAGHELKDLYFFYTTCPKCAKYYGKNYVVGFARVA